MLLAWSSAGVQRAGGCSVVFMVFLHCYLRWRYLHFLIRIFQEKPLFIIPRGQPLAEAERVRFPTSDGLTLTGCYLRSKQPRRGVILFGLEFGSNCWSCRSYCEHLLESGFDVFAFESRNQGTSDCMPGYDPFSGSPSSKCATWRRRWHI